MVRMTLTAEIWILEEKTSLWYVWIVFSSVYIELPTSPREFWGSNEEVF